MSKYANPQKISQSPAFDESNTQDIDNIELKTADFQDTGDIESKYDLKYIGKASLTKRLFSVMIRYKRVLIIVLLVIALISAIVSGLVIRDLNEREKANQRYWAGIRNKTMETKEKYLDSILAMKIEPTHNILVGISCGSQEGRRRDLMRIHQIEPYKRFPITFKFITGRIPSQYKKAIKAENDTYGDMIELTDIEDDRVTARSVKPFHWFQYVERMNVTYTYVGKMDTDTFMNIPLLFRDHFTETIQNYDIAALAPRIFDGGFYFPFGAFETFTWKFMLLINRFFENVGTYRIEEDIQIAAWCGDIGLYWVPADFTEAEAYDWYKHEDMVTDSTVMVHSLKNETSYLAVANCFNSEGVNSTAIDIARANDWYRREGWVLGDY